MSTHAFRGAAAGMQERWPIFAWSMSITLVFIVLGHEGRRVLQLWALALPVLAWQLWPIRHAGLRGLRAAIVWLLSMSFVADGIVRAYIGDTYQAAPDSSMVLSAIANTSGAESSEYAQMYWQRGVAWLLALALAGLCLGYCVYQGARLPVAGHARRQSAGRKAAGRARCVVLALCLAMSAIAYVSKPWRRLHPLLFWPAWSQTVASVRLGWQHQETERQEALGLALAARPVIGNAAPATVVLVISESINRDDLGLYGYARATSPAMLRQRDALAGGLVTLRNAWSVEATTVPALKGMLHVGKPGQTPLHVIALARAAGFKVWWIGNQDDVAIENLHGKLADRLELVNRTPGRASISPDASVLQPVRAAMADPTPRKLIIVHLMGAHPHYLLRFPAGANPFDHADDGVDRKMTEQGRSAWVREFRQAYDAALLSHDGVMSELLDIGRQGAAPDGYKAWMFLSDHGQEVGHAINHAGHSQSTAAGYRIPALIWQSTPRKPLPADLASRPFRGDWTGTTLAGLMDIRWDGYQASHDVLDAQYQWEAPTLGAAITSFVD